MIIKLGKEFLTIFITKLGKEFFFNYTDYTARTRVCLLVILITKLGQEFVFSYVDYKVKQKFFITRTDYKDKT